MSPRDTPEGAEKGNMGKDQGEGKEGEEEKQEKEGKCMARTSGKDHNVE